MYLFACVLDFDCTWAKNSASHLGDYKTTICWLLKSLCSKDCQRLVVSELNNLHTNTSFSYRPRHHCTEANSSPLSMGGFSPFYCLPTLSLVGRGWNYNQLFLMWSALILFIAAVLYINEAEIPKPFSFDPWIVCARQRLFIIVHWKLCGPCCGSCNGCLLWGACLHLQPILKFLLHT